MLCPNCGTQLDEKTDVFCNKCGTKAQDTLADLKEQIATLEAQVRTVERLDQQRLTTEAAASAMGRVREWIGWLFYFAVIPLFVLALILSLVLGSEIWDVRKLAANATRDIQAAGEKGKKEAADATQRIDDAVGKAKKESGDITNTVDAAVKHSHQVKEQVDQLSVEVTARSNEIKTLGAQINGMKAQMDAQNKSVAQMRQDLENVTQEKATQRAKQHYPTAFGKHMAMSSSGDVVDRKDKKPGEIWVVMTLHESVEQIIPLDAFVSATKALQARYKTWDEMVSLVSGSPGIGGQNLGAFYNPGACTVQWVWQYWIK